MGMRPQRNHKPTRLHGPEGKPVKGERRPGKPFLRPPAKWREWDEGRRMSGLFIHPYNAHPKQYIRDICTHGKPCTALLGGEDELARWRWRVFQLFGLGATGPLFVCWYGVGLGAGWTKTGRLEGLCL